MQLDEYIRTEQAKTLYTHLKIVVPGTIAISAITVVVLWNTFNKTALSIWFVVSMGIVFFRWWTARGFRKDQENPLRSRYWLNLFVFWAALTGFNWGLVTILFYSSEYLVPVLLITCLYAGYMSAAMSSHALYLPAFLGFAIPCTVLIGVANLIEGGTIHYSIFAMVVLYAAVLFSFARNTNASFVETKRLYYENIQLMSEITRQKESAEKAVLAKNQFLAAASHDLRQPLHALGLFVDALKPYIKEEKGQGIRLKISQSTEALNSLLHGLLDISRLDASVVENHPKHISLFNLMSAIEEEYQSLAAEAGVELQVEIGPDVVVFADGGLLERVLRNLIDNAVKYTRAGYVRLHSEKQDDCVKVVIQDSGIGIPADRQKEVFDEFRQLDNPNRDRRRGLGLGLSIVRRLCDLMGVALEMQSEEGNGTRVTLQLEKGVRVNKPAGKQKQPEFTGPVRILAIDDERDILEAMERVFEAWHCEIITVTDIKSAMLAVVEDGFEPDVILADFRLGFDESGLDAIERLREERNENIPAILITGDTAPDRVREARNSDVLVMYKPIHPAKMRAEVKELVGQLDVRPEAVP